MIITVKTAGSLGRYLPEGSSGNLAEVEVPEDTSPTDVIGQLGFPTDGSYMVILNGKSVPKAERAGTRLTAGDKLAIMPPLKGG